MSEQQFRITFQPSGSSVFLLPGTKIIEAGGMGLISGRKTFQKPMKEGVKIFNAIQDVYLCKEITVA